MQESLFSIFSYLFYTTIQNVSKQRAVKFPSIKYYNLQILQTNRRNSILSPPYQRHPKPKKAGSTHHRDEPHQTSIIPIESVAFYSDCQRTPVMQKRSITTAKATSHKTMFCFMLLLSVRCHSVRTTSLNTAVFE